jgi:pyruvate dehydrogenase E2 component (dihydrolipoamide acetyltransferase)
MRRAIARITAASAATVPQFHLSAELDAAPLLTFRQRLIEDDQPTTRARLSITDLLLRAMALALRDQPAANAIWVDDTIVALGEINVGLAINLDDGLLVATLRNVDMGSLAALASQRRDLVAAARGTRLPAQATARAATSLSNLGTTRVDDFTAVVFPPQSAILTAGRIVERPFVVDGRLVATPTLRLTLTVDHRVLDGAPAAQFLGRIVHYLERPSMAIDEMPPR